MFGLWIWGTTLTDVEADVVYGLVMRMSEGLTGKGIPMPRVPENEAVARPKWVGAVVHRYPSLDVRGDIQYHALRFDDPRVPVECPRECHERGYWPWHQFTNWLETRNVYLRDLAEREGMYFVTDYD